MFSVYAFISKTKKSNGLYFYRIGVFFRLNYFSKYIKHLDMELLKRFHRACTELLAVDKLSYYQPEVRRREYWGWGIFLLQYFPLVKI